jgi:hypothetical protein
MLRSDSLPARLGLLRSSLASRSLACCRGVRGVPHGLAAWWTPPGHARAWGRPLPLSGHVARRQVVLPSSPVTPRHACPALRPRWCPRHAPYGAQDCCLPATGNRRRSPRYDFEKSPVVHDYTYCGAQSHGLHPRYTRLRTPPCGDARGFAPDLLARLESGGIGAVPARTHWVPTTSFMGSLPMPRFWAYLGATSAWFGGGRDAGMRHATPLPGRPARLWHPAWVPSPSGHPSTPPLVGTTSRLPPPRGPPNNLLSDKYGDYSIFAGF